MTINLISDIHCRNTNFTPNFHFEKLAPADVLVVAGDIGIFTNRDKIIKKINDNYIGKDKQFKHLVYCWGNHDYYATDDHWFKRHNDLYCGPLFSDNHIDIIDNVAFICTTMWSPISDRYQFAIANGMNDYRWIRGFTTSKSTELFKRSAQWIIDMIELYKSQNMKTVVVTHHLPDSSLISPEFQTGSLSVLNDGFAVMDREWSTKLIEARADLWLHGHSHQIIDKTLGNTRCIRNPFGYDWPHIQEFTETGFSYNNIIEI